MRSVTIAVSGLAAFATLVLGWGSWHASRHAYLNIKVNDYALATEQRTYGTPNQVTLAFRDQAKCLLAHAKSTEASSYISAVHPDASIGNCAHLRSQTEHAACYEEYVLWSATWAPLVRWADVAVGACTLRNVPVKVMQETNHWWVPLPHIGGEPRRYYTFTVAVESKGCSADVKGQPSSR